MINNFFCIRVEDCKIIHFMFWAIVNLEISFVLKNWIWNCHLYIYFRFTYIIEITSCLACKKCYTCYTLPRTAESTLPTLSQSQAVNIYIIGTMPCLLCTECYTCYTHSRSKTKARLGNKNARQWNNQHQRNSSGPDRKSQNQARNHTQKPKPYGKTQKKAGGPVKWNAFSHRIKGIMVRCNPHALYM